MRDMLVPWPFYYSNLKIPPTVMSNKNKTDHSLLIVFFFFLHLYKFTCSVNCCKDIRNLDVWCGFFVLILVTKLFTKKRTLCQDISWHKLSKYKYYNSPRLLLHLKTNEAECSQCTSRMKWLTSIQSMSKSQNEMEVYRKYLQYVSQYKNSNKISLRS